MVNQRLLHFTKENTLYLLLNIIAHDVIHDYGSTAPVKRWENNKSLIRNFTREAFTFNTSNQGGDPPGKRSREENLSQTITEDNQMDTGDEMVVENVRGNINTLVPRRLVKAKWSSPSQKLGMSPNLNLSRGITSSNDIFMSHYEDYLTQTSEYKDHINNTIILTVFNHLLLLYSKDINHIIDFRNAELYIVPCGVAAYDSDELLDVFTDIKDRFIGYCYNNKIRKQLDYKTFIAVLTEFLSGVSVDLCISENVDSSEPDSVEPHVKKQRMGGAKGDETVNVDDARLLIDEIETYKSRSDALLTKISDIYEKFYATEQVTNDEKNTYTRNIKEYSKGLKDILRNYEQNKKAGGVDNFFNKLPPLVRASKTKYDILDYFNDQTDALLEPYIKIVKEYEDEVARIEQRKFEDARKELSGKLTRADSEVRENFSKFIAKSGLFLTEICDKDGYVASEYDKLEPNSFLRKQINILLYISGSDEWWGNNPEWQEVTAQSLDNVLIDFFVKQYRENMIMGSGCSKVGQKYVINNSAPISQKLSSMAMCPYTSILDGMTLCSWKDATNTKRIEYGNMDFKITNIRDQIYYNGSMVINKKGNSFPTECTLRMEVKLPGITLAGSKNIKINGNDIKAYVVLGKTLVNLIEYISGMDQNVRDKIFEQTTGKDYIFTNLFDWLVNNQQDFNKVYSEILFKGTGDIFQEINSVCKYGGYTMENYFSNDTVLQYIPTNGNQVRFFAANDRPSGTRFMFILLNGKENEINTKASGGYYSENDQYIVNRRGYETCNASKGGRKRVTKKHISSKNKTRKHS